MLLRLNVQKHDFPGLVDHHHRIWSRLQQPAVSALHLRQMPLRGLAHADVADRRRHQDSLGAFEWTQHDLDWKLTSILPPPDELKPRPDMLRQRLGSASRTIGDQAFRKTLGNDVFHLLSNKFIAAIPELLFRLDIKKDDLTALIHHHHRIRSRFQ